MRSSKRTVLANNLFSALLTIAAALLVSTPGLVHASPSAVDDLTGWLQTVEYDGCEMPFIREYYESIVLSGFLRLMEANPALVRDRVSTTLTDRKRVILKCRDVSTAMALINSNPVALIVPAYSEHSLREIIRENLRAQSDVTEEAIATMAKNTIELNKSSIFHETLHYFKFDNLPIKIHNDVNFLVGNVTSDDPRFASSWTPLRGASLDVVHSCTQLAFSDPRGTEPNACEQATAQGKQVILPWNRITQALKIRTVINSNSDFSCIFQKNIKVVVSRRMSASGSPSPATASIEGLARWTQENAEGCR